MSNFSDTLSSTASSLLLCFIIVVFHILWTTNVVTAWIIVIHCNKISQHHTANIFISKLIICTAMWIKKSGCHLPSYLDSCIYRVASLHVRNENIRFPSREAALNPPFHYQTVSMSRWESTAFREDERSLLWKADWPELLALGAIRPWKQLATKHFKLIQTIQGTGQFTLGLFICAQTRFDCPPLPPLFCFHSCLLMVQLVIHLHYAFLIKVQLNVNTLNPISWRCLKYIQIDYFFELYKCSKNGYAYGKILPLAGCSTISCEKG